MYRPTGPGEIDVLFEGTGANILEARLYDFDFDDFDGKKVRPLKPKHAKFLEDRVVPLLENNSGNIWIQGSASRIGPAGWNMVLSQVRESAVQAFLLDRGIKAEQIQVEAVGETLATRHALDDPRDRGVLISVHPSIKNPPLPKKIPPRPKITNQFKIAVDGKFPQKWATHHDYISLGEKILKKIVKKLPVSTLELPFIVWDIKNGLSCRYVYISLAGGFDFSASSSLPDPHGPWNDFTTEKPIGCWQFGRGARMTTAGVGGHSKTYLHIDTPDGVNNVVTTIDTGITIKGASGSIGLPGDFILMEAPALFGGP